MQRNHHSTVRAFCKVTVQYTWHLSTTPTLHCLKIRVKSRPSALQPHPQAALRIPVYPTPVIFLYSVKNKLPQATWSEGHRSQILLDPLPPAFCIKFSKNLGNQNTKLYQNLFWYVAHSRLLWCICELREQEHYLEEEQRWWWCWSRTENTWAEKLGLGKEEGKSKEWGYRLRLHKEIGLEVKVETHQEMWSLGLLAELGQEEAARMKNSRDG